MNRPKRDDAARSGAAPGETDKHANHQDTSKATGRLAVIVFKSSGTRVVFSTYSDVVEAQRVVEQLNNIGCVADVERAVVGDVAGAQRRASS